VSGLRFGFLTLQNTPWLVTVERWRLAERLGWDSVWVADHFVNPFQPTDDWFDGWSLLAALARETRTIRIGVLVSSLTLRPPALLARQALTVDHLSGGRLELGLGAGGVPLDHSMTGTPPWSRAERAARFAEAVVLVDQLLRRRQVTFGGRFYRVHEALTHPGPVQAPRPPLTIGALGPAMMRVAARHADTWNTFGGRHVSVTAAFADTRERLARFDDYCLEAGRDPVLVRRSFLALAHYVPDDYWASVGAFVDFVGRYAALGIREFIFDWPPDDRHSLVERLAVDVLPGLRAPGTRHPGQVTGDTPG
jgi:alkanesulfonate monooxygenase SsuD/methylene tetrahydromethanopterin reductase-like flavin-dependent oxidoreductase (luciferase family)